MFKSDIQIELKKETWIPGESILGNLLITTADEFDTEDITIHFIGCLSSQFYKREKLLTRRLCDNNNTNNSNNWDKKLGYEPHVNFVPNSNPKDSDKWVSDSGNSVCSSDNLNDFQNADHTEYTPTDTIHTFKRNIIEFSQLLNDKPRKFRPGVTIIPFSIVPSGPDLTNCFSSGVIRNGNELVEVKYYVKAKIRYPFSWLKYVNLTWSRSSDVIVNSKPSKNFEKNKVETKYEVGLWRKNSTSFGKVLYYYFGGDTASQWYPMILRTIITNPVIISWTEPHYIQTSVDITTVEVPSDAPLEVSDGITCKTSDKVSNDVEVSPQMEVRTVKVFVKTSVIIDGDLLHKIEKRTMVGHINNAAFQFNPKTVTNLTCLLSGFKLPISLMSTTQSSLMCVNHTLVVKLGISSVSPDGTRQAVRKVYLDIPLIISREDQNNSVEK